MKRILQNSGNCSNDDEKPLDVKAFGICFMERNFSGDFKTENEFLLNYKILV